MKSLSCVWLFVTPWTVACQAPPFFGFSRQKYWNGLPFPSPGDLPDPGIELGSPTFQSDSLTSEPPMLLSQFIPPSPTQLGLSHLIHFLTFCSWYLYMWKIRQRGGEYKETRHQQTFESTYLVGIALSYCQEPWNQRGSPGYSQWQQSSLPRLNTLPHSSTALSGYGILSRFYNWEAVSSNIIIQAVHVQKF